MSAWITWNSIWAYSGNSAKFTPPPKSTVAVSGTLSKYFSPLIPQKCSQPHLYTFQPRFSKKVESLAWPVVLPPHGPPVSTSFHIFRFFCSAWTQKKVNFTQESPH